MSHAPPRYARRILPALALSGLLAGGCAHAPLTVDPAFRAADPRSILIVPVVNRSTDIAAADMLLSTLPVPVAEHGYYVFPVDLVKRVLEDEGNADADFVHRADPSRLRALFGADAILYVEIEKWTVRNALTSTSAVVEVDYVLRDGKTGKTIWKGHGHREEVRGADPLAAAMAAAILRALPAGAFLVPMARQATSQAIESPRSGLPPGPYHPDYLERAP